MDISKFSTFFSFPPHISRLKCVFLIFRDFQFSLFHVLKCVFLIFRDFQFSCHNPGPSVCISHFSRFLVNRHFSSRQVDVSHFP
ncbi:Uncharacterised protein [Chlamydia abortus]|nr:Uncharacterised protein [Chlamydia abortus]